MKETQTAPQPSTAARQDGSAAIALPAPSASSLLLQPKLLVGHPDDPLEHEADRAAERVVSLWQGGGFGAPPAETPAQPSTPLIQRRAASPAAGAVQASPQVTQQIQSAQGGGQALPAALQPSLEAAFGMDFSGVRLHTDTRADALNRDLQARAFTTGQDIFFRQGEYQPRTAEGVRLLGHELGHVGQQGGEGMIRRQVVQETGRTSSRQRRYPRYSPAAGYSDVAVLAREGETVEDLVRRSAEILVRGILRDFVLPSNQLEQARSEVIATIPSYNIPPETILHESSGYLCRFPINEEQRREMYVRWAMSWVRAGIEAAQQDASNQDNPESHTSRAAERPEGSHPRSDSGDESDTPRAPQVERAIWQHMPAEIEGLQVQVRGGTGSYSMRLTSRDIFSQLAAQFSAIEYNWTVWNVSAAQGLQGIESRYNLMNIPQAPEFRSVEMQIQQGVTPAGARRGRSVGRGETGRIDRFVSDMGERPTQILEDRAEAMQEGRIFDALTNDANLALYPIEFGSRVVVDSLATASDQFENRNERQIAWRTPGVYIISCRAVIRTDQDTPEAPTFAPAVATTPVVVADADMISHNALYAQEEELAQARMQMAMLMVQEPRDEEAIANLQEQIVALNIHIGGSASQVIYDRYLRRNAELTAMRATPGRYTDRQIRIVEREVEELRQQYDFAMRRGSGMLGWQRLRAALTTRVSGNIYPLLLEIREPYFEDGSWHCILSDVTDRNGGMYTIQIAGRSDGDVTSIKLRAVTEAIELFAGSSNYEEGTLSMLLPSAWFSHLPPSELRRSFQVRPRDGAAVRQRMAELVQIITLLGLAVPGLAVVGTVINAALAADRLAQHWRNGTFDLENSINSISDLMDVLSAAAVGLGTGVRAFGPLVTAERNGGFILRLSSGAQRVVDVAAHADDILDVAGVIICNAEATANLIRLSSQTGPEARLERARIIAGVIQSNGPFFRSHSRRSESDSARVPRTPRVGEPESLPPVDAPRPLGVDLDHPRTATPEAPPPTILSSDTIEAFGLYGANGRELLERLHRLGFNERDLDTFLNDLFDMGSTPIADSRRYGWEPPEIVTAAHVTNPEQQGRVDALFTALRFNEEGLASDRLTLGRIIQGGEDDAWRTPFVRRGREEANIHEFFQLRVFSTLANPTGAASDLFSVAPRGQQGIDGHWRGHGVSLKIYGTDDVGSIGTHVVRNARQVSDVTRTSDSILFAFTRVNSSEMQRSDITQDAFQLMVFQCTDGIVLWDRRNGWRTTDMSGARAAFASVNPVTPI